MKRIIIFSLIAGCSLLSAWRLERSETLLRGADFYASRLEKPIRDREVLMETWLADTARFDLPTRLQEAAAIPDLALFLFDKGNQPFYWSDPALPLPGLPPISKTSQLLHLADGFYLARGATDTSGVQAILLLPIYRIYAQKELALQNYFPLTHRIPNEITFSALPPGTPIHSRQGVALGYLHSSSPVPHPIVRFWSIFLFGLGSLFLLLIAEHIGRRRHPALSGIFPLALLAGLRYLGGAIFMLPSADRLVKMLTTPLGSLRPIDILSILLASYLLERAYRGGAFLDTMPARGSRSIFQWGPVTTIGAGYGLLIIFLTGLAILIRQVVLYSPLHFDFDNIFHQNPSATLILLIILTLLHPVYRLAEAIIRMARVSGLSGKRRRLAALAGVVPAAGLSLAVLPELPIWESLLVLLIFSILLDLYIDYYRQSLTWLIIWLVFFSALTAVLFYKFYLERQTVDLLKQAQASAETIPSRTGADLKELILPWQTDSSVNRPAAIPPHFRMTTSTIRDSLSPIRVVDHLAIVENGQIRYSRGIPNLDWLKQAALPPPGGWIRRLDSERADLIYRTETGRLILVGQLLGGYTRPLALFSFFFVLLLLMLVADTGITAILTGAYRHAARSLRFRLQLAIIGLIGGAFILIGLVTANAFRQTARKEQRERVYEKMTAIRQEVSGNTDFYPTPSLLEHLANMHHIGLAFYNGKGLLSAASTPDMYTSGLLPSRLPMGQPPGNWQEIKTLSRKSTAGEKIRIQTTFAATGLPSSSPAAFIGLSTPFYDNSFSRDLYSFIGSLINVYVFLLLAASVIAIAVANSITRPLDQIGEKLQALRLGRNTPLEWEGDDEIGQLIGAYNRMITKLEESTRQLRRSEREDAWREMARQVAHEIKNPLTPMKLGIQYLERAYRADPEHARELVMRVSRTLLEQIDALTRIATEFSSFAKMPRPENSLFPLQELVASAFHLFEQNPEYPAKFSMQLPEEPVYVRADRTQLLRVLNNLLKNALQALSGDRPGKIDVSLWSENDKAVLRIRDNGTGISAEVRERVFYPNFTTKSSGMGLGLAMCKGMIEQMEGRIYFETTVGEGTDFYVELPKVEE